MKFAISISMERFSPADSMSTAMSNMLALARIADEGGFETLWTAEHHTIECTVSPNPFAILTWLSQHTQRIRLGTATLVAPYWSPIRLAGEAAMCDHLTGGRLEFGIARGAYQYEFDRMAGGIPQQEGVGYMKELVPAVQKLWAGDYAHDGPPAVSTGRWVSVRTSCLRRCPRRRPKSRCWARNSARRLPTIPSVRARVS
jgi:alkanesulfonate monooxygenase SsuD/methylene tetrahydromethanopterin reductase-like flavin-dependent oxidoreductase (luciferase family)